MINYLNIKIFNYIYDSKKNKIFEQKKLFKIFPKYSILIIVENFKTS